MPLKGRLADTKYSWAEIRSPGAGPRGIRIAGPGVDIEWTIDPNPHGIAAYNNDQEGLYVGFVDQLNDGWPERGDATCEDIRSVDDIPDKKVKKQLMEMKKDKQDKALKNYNAERRQAAEAAAEETYRAAVERHLNRKKRITVDYGTETFGLK